MNGVQTRFKCKLDVKRCKRFVFPPSSLLPRSNALKTKAIRYFQTDRTLTRIVSPPLPDDYGLWAGKELIINEAGDNEPEILYGPYFRVTGSYGAWNWTNLVCGGFNCPADVAAAPADYNFKFEVYSPTGHPFYDSAGYGYLIQLNNGNYPWNPSANGSFNTYGKWCTVSIDLQTVSGNAFSEGWTGLSFILQPNSDWNVDHSFANIRIEKKIR